MTAIVPVAFSTVTLISELSPILIFLSKSIKILEFFLVKLKPALLLAEPVRESPL